MGTFSDYQREERTGTGKHRLVITNAEEAISKSSGNPMIVIEVMPSGSKAKIKHYFPKNQYFNQNMTQFFDSFDIEDGDFTLLGWIGAMGAGDLIEDENGYLKVKRFIKREHTEELPAWQGEKPERNTLTEFKEMDDDGDMPF